MLVGSIVGSESNSWFPGPIKFFEHIRMEWKKTEEKENHKIELNNLGNKQNETKNSISRQKTTCRGGQ